MKLTLFSILLFLSFNVNAQVFDTLISFQEYAVLFESDEWELDHAKYVNLDSILSFADIADSIVIEGHTDEVGSEVYNQKLSDKRARSVKEKMLSIGVEKDKISTAAFGERLPARIGSKESSYQWNRRVSIRYYKIQKRRKIFGQVVDSGTKEGLVAKVKLTGKDFLDSTMTQLDGRYVISAPDKGIYKLEISADNHFFEQRFIKISPLDPVEINVDLPEIKIGAAYTLPNFNFKGNLPVLLDSSVPTLNQLYEMLTNSTFCIEIEGHINRPNQPPCKKETWHYKLSVDRAEMVHKSMQNKGIAAERMLPKGYGNWEMLYPNTFDEREMRENRRVEIKIIDCESEELLLKHSQK